jgi:hypothetical protein
MKFLTFQRVLQPTKAIPQFTFDLLRLAASLQPGIANELADGMLDVQPFAVRRRSLGPWYLLPSYEAYGVFLSALCVIAWPVAEMSSPAPAVA